MHPEFVDPDRGPWPLHEVAAARAAEAAALASAAPHELMQRAGLASARLALALAPHASRFAVFAGPGNNGGDGLVAATRLHEHGHAVQVQWIGDPARLPADAARALASARAAGVALIPPGGALASWDFALDALLGLGSRRAPQGEIAAAIEAMNRSRRPVLALDLPSGLDADRGQPFGEVVVHASATLALLSLKPGLFTGRGRDLAGTVWLDRLGLEGAGATAELSAAPAWLPRRHASHKGSYGDVAVVGGAPGMAGAAWLAARAALAAGAGRVFA
ncbi:MAG: NAD(P)H-hydrate epimerase, partial [Burkholderiales bacterium]|nr:NAD(P)H-hydrate epimerase [Burkholderiales bacterium]